MKESKESIKKKELRRLQIKEASEKRYYKFYIIYFLLYIILHFYHVLYFYISPNGEDIVAGAGGDDKD
jgi:hypothetical protein